MNKVSYNTNVTGHFPTSLYGPDGRRIVNVVKKVRGFVLACLHDPFVWSYSNVETGYKKYLQKELFKRQVEYVRGLKTKYSDYKTAVTSLNGNGLSPAELNKLKTLLELTYGGFDLKSIPDELWREVRGLRNSINARITTGLKKFCEEYRGCLEDLYRSHALTFKKEYIEDCLSEALAKKIREEKTIEAGTIAVFKKDVEEKLSKLLTSEGRVAGVNAKIWAVIQSEIIFDSLLFASEALWGQFGCCGFHDDPVQIMAFWRLAASIAAVILTMPIMTGFFSSLWELSAIRGGKCAPKTWSETFKKVETDVQSSWDRAKNNIGEFHPFIKAIVDTALVMIPWAVLCYFDMRQVYYRYASMDIFLHIKRKLLSENNFPDIKEMGEYLAIGWLRGYLKFWLMPKDQPLIRMIAYDDLLTMLSVLSGKVMHILYPFGNAAKPEGVR